MIKLLRTLSMFYFLIIINAWESVFKSIFENKVEESSCSSLLLITKKFSDSNNSVISLKSLIISENLSALLSFNNLCKASEKS